MRACQEQGVYSTINKKIHSIYYMTVGDHMHLYHGVMRTDKYPWYKDFLDDIKDTTRIKFIYRDRKLIINLSINGKEEQSY